MTEDNRFDFIPLSKPILITEQKWPQGITPLVHIRTMTYMHENFIRDCIEGILMQKTTFPVLVLIHDDASTDGTKEVLQDYENKFPHLIKGFYQSENIHQNPDKRELQRPFRTAHRGKYIAICEGDDYWTDPLKLQKQVDFLEAHPDYAVCVGGFNRLYEQSGVMISRLVRVKGNDEELNGYTFSLNDMKRKWLTQPLTAIFRRELLEKMNLKVYNHSRDVHLFYHLLKLGKGFYMTGHLGVHRIHPGGLHSMQDQLQKSSKAYQIYKGLFEVNRDGFTRFKYFHSIVKLLNANLYHRRWRNNQPRNMKLFVKAVSLIRDLRDVALLMSVVLPVHKNNMEKEK